MRKINLFLIVVFYIVTTTQWASGQKAYNLFSPDKKIKLSVTLSADGKVTYSFTARNRCLIKPSSLGIDFGAEGVIPSEGWNVTKVETQKVDTIWTPVWGKRSVVADRFNELALDMSGPSTGISFLRIVFRAYNDGVAFRYVAPAIENQVKELTSYNFDGDYMAWFYNGENHNIGPERLSAFNGRYLPIMTIQAADDHFMALHEADLSTGKPLVLETKNGSTSFYVVPQKNNLLSGGTSPWRVIMYGATAGALVDSHLIELLNPDPLPEYDFSWVKPGVAVWDWRIDGAQVDNFTYTMSYPSWIRMVDFAAEQGIKHLVLDANWYGPEHEAESDPIEGEKAADVQRLLKYGKEKGVGIWLYLNDVGGRKYDISKTLAQYGKWGATGVKYGFMSGTPEQKNTWTRLITKLCADNRLLVNFHDGPVHPYGQMRTWPNAVTREFCHAQLDAHRVFLPKTFVTSVFVNMLAGPIDMNNGMFDLRQGNTTRVDESKPVPSTLVSEAARTLIVFSGVTILPDIPEFYRKYPDLLRFISAQKMPWKESRTLDGKIGEYIVMCRQTDEHFLVAAATNESPRELTIPLSFLPKGKYKMLLIQDGPGAHYLTNREVLQSETYNVTHKESVKVHLASGGGACILIERVTK